MKNAPKKEQTKNIMSISHIESIFQEWKNKIKSRETLIRPFIKTKFHELGGSF